MTDVSTRLATPDDLPAVLEMAHALAARHGDIATVTRADLERDCLGANPWTTLIIATKFNKPSGYAALCPLTQLQFGARGMDMHHLFVKSTIRGQGIGRLLINASMDHAKRLGSRYIMVGTHPENIPAQEIYLAGGIGIN